MNVTPQAKATNAGAQESDIERGSFVRDRLASGETTKASRLVVATYNIRYAVGSHLVGGSTLRRLGVSRPGRRSRLVGGNIGRAARVLSDGARMPRADIVALQEADRGTMRAGGQHGARGPAEALHLSYV